MLCRPSLFERTCDSALGALIDIKARAPLVRKISAQLPAIASNRYQGEQFMTVHEKVKRTARFGSAHGPARLLWVTPLLLGVALYSASPQQVTAADLNIVVVDVVAVADGYRASKLRGTKVINSKNEKIGELDDLVVGKDRVLFAIVQVGGFLGIGSRLIAVPYTSLQINDDGSRIVLPGATKQQLEQLPEFKYR
jgi:sporulation protein YlmC with PRC-barrel domain